MNNAERFQRVDELFRAVLPLAAAEREAYLRAQAPDDDALVQEVLELIQSDEHSRGFLETPALGAGFAVGAAASDAPEQIGPYRILGVLGEGGMGVVYEAEQAEPKRRVALKLVRSGLSDEEVRRRFRYEAELLGRLHDPRIAQIYEAGADSDGRPYFAMELVTGEPLIAAADSESLSQRDRAALIADIAEAVHHAHQRGVIHRDLKPANVLVQRDGTPKVLDFGVARATEREPGETLHTTAGQILGTPAYMSPEQASGDPARVDARTDVYALGAMAYELFAGRPPIDVAKMAPLEAVTAVREREPARLASVARATRGDLDTIVHKAIEHDPDRRYPSAAEFAADLRRWLADEPIVARPATLRYQLGRFTRRNRALVIAACIGVASLIAATATSTAFAVRAAEARAEAERAAEDAQNARAEAERDRDAAIDATRAALTAQEAERAQREQAETQRTLAEARFNDVRTLAGALVFDIEAQLRDLPGATEARRALISTGVRYLDLLAEDADDPALLDEVARSYMRIADVQGGQRTASLGDSDAALASLNKSADIRRALLERNPDSERDRLWLSAALKFTAETLTATGRSDEALAKLEEALELGNDQIERTPESFGARRDRGLTLGATADLLMTLGQTDRAHELFTEARAQAEVLAEQAEGTPGAGRLLRDLAIAQGDEGRALVALGRTDDALARYTESAATRERLLEANPTSARARRDMISLAARIGDLEQGRGNYAPALGWHRRALALAESAVRDDASNTTALYNLSVSLENVCDALLELARIDEAAAAAERCVDLRRRLIEVDPSNTHWAVALAVAVERAGRVAERVPDADAANAHYAEAYDLAERVSAADPAAALPWRVLLFTSSRLGELETAAAEAARSPGAVLERAEAARQWLTRAGAALDGMNARSITPYTTQATREELAAVESRVDQIAPTNAERVQ